MTGTDVNMGLAWAERTLVVLLLPFAFVVMVGGGTGMIWLWRDYGAQFWIGLCVIAILAVLASVAWSVTSRYQRRRQWLAQRAGPAADQATDDDSAQRRSAAELETADSRELMLEMLSRIDVMQRNLDVLMGEFTSVQQRAGSGRHAGPIMVDLRDDIEILDGDEDFDDLDDFEDTNDFDDLPDFDGLDEDPDSLDELSDVSLNDEKHAESSPSQLETPMAGRDAGETPEDSTNPFPGSPDPEHDRAAGSGDSLAAEAETGEDTSREIHQAPERRMRRLVQDHTSTQQRDSIPAPREPVQVIELPRDDQRDMEIEDDDDDYFGAGFDDIDEGGRVGVDSVTDLRDDSAHGTDAGRGDTMNDGDDDERPRDARS